MTEPDSVDYGVEDRVCLRESISGYSLKVGGKRCNAAGVAEKCERNG